MTRDEAISFVDQITKCEGTEKELDDMLQKLKKLVPKANILDMLFWEKADWTSAELVDEAIRRNTDAGKTCS